MPVFCCVCVLMWLCSDVAVVCRVSCFLLKCFIVYFSLHLLHFISFIVTMFLCIYSFSYLKCLLRCSQLLHLVYVCVPLLLRLVVCVCVCGCVCVCVAASASCCVCVCSTAPASSVNTGNDCFFNTTFMSKMNILFVY